MNSDIEVIWSKSDNEMPDNVKHVIMAAQDELLLRALKIPADVVNTIRYNASKSNKTINEYLSYLILENIKV